MSNQLHDAFDCIVDRIRDRKGFYESIFESEEYQELEEDEKEDLVGMLIGYFGLSCKDLIDECVKEKVKSL